MSLGQIKRAFTFRDIGIEPQESVLLFLFMSLWHNPGSTRESKDKEI
jgi:hypothetical protein